jgi:hypothetical protein
MLKKAAALLCVATFTLTACGNSDADTAKENLKAKMMSSNDSLGTKATDKEATCIADGMVDKIGVEQLQKYHFLTKDLKVSDKAGGTTLKQDDAEAFAKVYIDCIDMAELLTERAKEAKSYTQDQKDCIKGALDEKVMEKGLAALFQGKQDEEYTKMQMDVQKCTTPAESKTMPEKPKKKQ